MLEYAIHDLDPRQVDVRDGRLECTLLGVHQVEQRRLPCVRSVEVAERPHDDDPTEVDFLMKCAAEEGLERGVVFLSGGTVDAGPVREEFGRVVEGLAEYETTVVHVRGRHVALDDLGPSLGCCLDVVGAVGLGGGTIVQLCCLREADGLGSREAE